MPASTLTLIRIRNKEDFELLFREYYSSLCGYANTFLKDPAASEEIVQEVMVKIWQNRDRISFSTSVRSYLFSAVRNGCMNLINHLEIRDEYKKWNELSGYGNELVQEDKLIVSELESAIRKAIDDLPMERRKIFIMSRYDGLTYQEIASKLGISVKTVENQMSSALRKLRTDLADYLPWLILFFYDIYKN
jgi:RNA polymerase sigma-70 factor (ECF subfamily)